MSNIYILEPPTNGKVLLETTAGEIDVELWSKETPKACRNFVQLCMEGYYDNTIFHRLVKDFIVQGGCPKGDGTGGHSIYGQPFKDEIHSRLRFTRRGLVAMANGGRDDNASQFFFTLGPAPELQGKHTIFAKVEGNTLYNMIKLGEGEADQDERPLFPFKILRTKILNNPFDDIVPRELIKKEKKSKKEKITTVGTKNYKLLSFGDEAEEDEDETSEMTKKFNTKGKSSHDLANDPKLSSKPIEIEADISDNPRKRKHSRESESSDEELSKMESREPDLSADAVRSKLKKYDNKKHSSANSKPNPAEPVEDFDYYLGKEMEMEKKRKLDSLKQQVKELRRELKKSKEPSKAPESISEDGDTDKLKLAEDNNMVKEYLDIQKEYKGKAVKGKGTEREKATMAILAKFQNKLRHATETYGELESIAPEVAENSSLNKESGEIQQEPPENVDDDSWLARKLVYSKTDPILAKDASTKSDDWFEIYDPRNRLAKRRREGRKDDRNESRN